MSMHSPMVNASVDEDTTANEWIQEVQHVYV